MSPGFDVGQELAASLSSRQEAWRFIRRYAEHWLTPPSDDDGWTEADLQAAEQRLGLRLPPAIREAYALFGRRQDLTSVQDRLLGPALCQAGDSRLPDVGLPGGSVRWFTGREVLVCDFAGTWLWVRARTTGALDAVRVALPGEWLMSPNG